MFVVEREDFNALFDILTNKGYEIIGPTVRDSAIIYDKIRSINDLPIGITDYQDKMVYRLRKRNDNALFGYVVGPYSWKSYLFPPRVRLFKAERKGDTFNIVEDRYNNKYAFIGVRACEINAIHIQDRVFLYDKFKDPIYEERRENIFIAAVNCTLSSNTCFCTSMKTGPKVEGGYDLVITEILEPRHYFIIEVGSDKGYDVLKDLKYREATKDEINNAIRIIESNAKSMKKSMDTTGIKELLYNNYENKYWNNVAERCLACTNCTMVCPTCFCSNVEDITDLKGEYTERWRVWDSCFTSDFTYMHGNPSIRNSTTAKYRHWIVHKLASWIDQFGTSGCVGCGRCITWCPVGIDITEEIASLRKVNSNEYRG
jgi:formate hydrogenlyase subunit 6/NADH:ubiquinone oxidoreductase subunit I